MRTFRQWCVWRYEDLEGPKPTKVPYSAKTGRLASVTDGDTWSTYGEAITAAANGLYSGIGFVLTEFDPYCFIDLDDPYQKNQDGSPKYPNAQDILDRQIRVYSEFDSYAERSPSGAGLHVIVKGVVPSGRRRSAIEIYSSERYMTMTGNVYRDKPIMDYNSQINALWSQMGTGNNAIQYYFHGAEEKEPDAAVIEKATNAENGEKFVALLKGEYQSYYASQSEADLAFINIVAFYTQNKQQIFRIFKSSGLGQRDKAKRVDYFNWNVNKAFDRMLPPVDIEGLQNQIAEALAESKKKPPIVEVIEAVQSSPNPYSVPPGLLGRLAQFIHAAAPRPVPEIALAGAIGLMAGIVGRAYNVSGTGLNQYVLLLAPTGTGKEAIASGFDKLMAAVQRTVPAAMEFIGPAEISSAQALVKYLGKQANSFVSLVGEFGIAMQQMSSIHAPPHLIGLRRMLLDLYNKSGEGKMLRPTIYSDKEKNTVAVPAPAFTLLGESTPERFYECLTEGMITEGLLPRFSVIEYSGPRPPLNRGHQSVYPSFELTEQLATLCAHALMLNSQHKAIHVQVSQEAKILFDAFDLHCDNAINSSEREIRRHLWNRAHIKALKLASLLAIGNDPYQPVVDRESAQWAMNLINDDVRSLLVKFDAGEIGTDNDETKQLVKLIQIIREYVSRPWSEVEKYKCGSVHLHAERIIPYGYLHKRTTQISEFKKDKMGASYALKRTIKTLMERGDIQECSRATMMVNYKSHAVCYMVATPRVFGL